MVWKLVQPNPNDGGETSFWRYEGRWRSDKFDGHGHLCYDLDGSDYKGFFQNGLRHGLAQERMRGDVYEGSFCDDRKNGQGVLTTKAGAVITGLFRNGECCDDNATIAFTLRGDDYHGSVRGVHPHGEGHMVYRNGDVYDGEFRNGVRSGVGVLQFASSDVFQGLFVDDAICGPGTMTYGDGSYFEGRIVKGLKQGQGIWYDNETKQKFRVAYRHNILTERSLVEEEQGGM